MRRDESRSPFMRDFWLGLVDVVRVAWPLPWTIWGLGWGVLALLTGGAGRREGMHWEFWGGLLPTCLRGMPIRGGAAAITFGHVILAVSAAHLDGAREHELVHVRQYERWGPLFIPAYLAASLVLFALRKSPYQDNPFEREAYGWADHSRLPGQRWLATKAMTLSLVSTFALLFSLLGRWWWLAELATHFRLLYLAAFLFSAVVWWIHQWERRAIAAATFAAVLGWPPSMPRLHPFTDRSESPSIRLILANVLSRNEQRDELVRWLRRQHPDLLVVCEVNADWERHLAQLDELPYRRVQAQPDNFGIGVWSRWPMQGQVFFPSASQVPAVLARLSTPQGPLTTVAIHPLPPVRRTNALDRNQLLAAVAVLARKEPLPLIVAGDLNCTPWSPFFHDLLRDGGLRDGRLGFGCQPSWPAWPCPLLPIDHTLTNSRVEVVGRELGPALGSDHHPVVLDFKIKSEP